MVDLKMADLGSADSCPSELYALAPIGVDTAWRESLSSYTSRLAEAHQVYPVTLVQQMILPRMDAHISVGKALSLAASLNGGGGFAARWQDVLRMLTRQELVQYLSLAQWNQVIPAKGLLRQHKAWCPACYQEWYEHQNTIYDPLIWTLQVTTTCPRHALLLATCCTLCQSPVPWLHGHVSIALCPTCGIWLGMSNALSPTEGELTWQQWVWKNIGLLAAHHNIAPPNRRQIAENIRRFCVTKIGISLDMLAKELQVAKHVVRAWITGEHIPTLYHLLRLCAVLGLHLDTLLAGNSEPQEQPHHVAHLLVQTSPSTEKARSFDKKQLQIALEIELSCLEEPTTMQQVARKIGVPYRRLYRQFPQLCRAISLRYRAFCAYRAEEEKVHFREAALQVKRMLLSEGTEPSVRKILAKVGMPRYNQFGTIFMLLQNLDDNYIKQSVLPKK